MNYKLLFIFALVFFISCNGDESNADYDTDFPVPKAVSIAAPEAIIFNVDKVFPHDPTAFTQGLEFYKGKLYEGTGEYGKSRLRVVDLETGKAEVDHLIEDPKIFGEGITIFKDKLYQLTWKNKKIFVYNLGDLSKPVATLKWNLEGWGLTHDGENMIISDGSSKLYFVEPDENEKTMKINKVLTVVNNRGEVMNLNELEYINGFIYANVWFSDEIVKIDPENGHVVGVMNLKGILKQYFPEAVPELEGVLNGIAYDNASNKIYVTGKNWPKLFELSLK